MLHAGEVAQTLLRGKASSATTTRMQPLPCTYELRAVMQKTVIAADDPNADGCFCRSPLFVLRFPKHIDVSDVPTIKLPVSPMILEIDAPLDERCMFMAMDSDFSDHSSAIRVLPYIKTADGKFSAWTYDIFIDADQRACFAFDRKSDGTAFVDTSKDEVTHTALGQLGTIFATGLAILNKYGVKRASVPASKRSLKLRKLGKATGWEYSVVDLTAARAALS